MIERLGLERLLKRPAPAAHWNGPLHTPVERLPMIAIDCETTGLDWRRDRIVAFAAVAIDDGLHIARQPALDLLIDPGVDVPEHATAVHGIDRAALHGAPPFARAFASILACLAGRIVVGHFVGFDLAVLGREAARARLPWREPPSFDTASLAASFGHRANHTDLVRLLEHFGIEGHGERHAHRHTAAGDARMAAELFAAMARRLSGLGRGTYGGVVAAHHRIARW